MCIRIFAIIALLIVLPTTLLPMQGQAQIVDPLPTASPPDDPVIPPPAFDWWMEPRYEEGWRRYNPHLNAYPSDYVYPDGWEIGINACSQFPVSNGIVRYVWRFEGTDIAYDTTVESTGCILDKTTSPTAPKLPRQGTYKVTLTMELSSGATRLASLNIKVTDILIVSLGDSNASGEGNPHVGITTAPNAWWDQRCHRSWNSGHAYMAGELERSNRRTSVTYLSFACSGAEVLEGLITPYGGIDDPGDGLYTKPTSQLRAVFNHICDLTGDREECIDNPRTIDKLFLSVGINDLAFSTLLKQCMTPNGVDDIDTDDLFIPGVINAAQDLDWDDIKARPVFETYGLIVELLDASLLIFDELFVGALKSVLEFFGSDAFACESDLDEIFQVNLASLWLNYEVAAAILGGNTLEFIDDLRADDWSYRWLDGDNRDMVLCLYGDLSAAELDSLPCTKAAMTEAIAHAIKPNEVYLTSYPADILTNRSGYRDGCKVFHGINHAEAEWLYAGGRMLNSHLALEAEKHNWHFVDGITKEFQTYGNISHGYCAGADAWYQSFSGSISTQLGIDGTIHPISDGHWATTRKMKAAISAPKPDFTDKFRVEVHFDEIRVNYSNTDDSTIADKTVLTLRVNDKWQRDPRYIKQLDIPFNQAVSLQGFGYVGKIAETEEIRVFAGASLPDLYIKPAGACKNDPFCSGELIKGHRFGMEEKYNQGNNFGLDTLCPRSSSAPNWTEATCVVEQTDGEGSFRIAYRIKVTELDHHLTLPPAPDLMGVCGPRCQSATSPPPPPQPLIVQYEQALAGTSLEAIQLVDVNQMLSSEVLPLQIETLGMGDQDARAYGIAQRGRNGRTVLVGQMSGGNSTDSEVLLTSYLGTGIMDTAFGKNGIVLVGGPGDDSGRDVIVQENGKIVVGGTYTANDIDFGIWRFHEDGTPDPSFGSEGFVHVDFGQGNDYVRKVLLRPNGHIVVAGYAFDGVTHDYAVVQLNPDGILDTSFGTGGIVRTDVGGGFAHARAAVLLEDGKIILAGGHSGKLLVLRYEPNGTLDTSFGTAGMAEIDLQRNSIVEDVVALADGRLALTGYSAGDLFLVILDGSGSQIGAPLYADFGEPESAYAMTMQPDGKIVLVGGGQGDNPAKGDILLVRYAPNGAGFNPDPSFATGSEMVAADGTIISGDGKMIISIGDRSAAKDVLLSPAGDLLLASFTKENEHDAVTLVKLKTDLIVDWRIVPEVPIETPIETPTPEPTVEPTSIPPTPAPTATSIVQAPIATPSPTGEPNDTNADSQTIFMPYITK